MARQNSDFTTALTKAVREIRRAQAAAQSIYQVRVPLEPEIRALERYIEMDAIQDREGISRRPAEKERLDRASESGREGGKSKSKVKGASSAENLRKYREDKKRMAAERLLRESAETTNGDAKQPWATPQQSGLAKEADDLRQIISDLAEEQKGLSPDNHVRPALDIAIELNKDKLRTVTEKMASTNGATK